MSKVTVVGAGNVGATCANVLAFNEVADESGNAGRERRRFRR